MQPSSPPHSDGDTRNQPMLIQNQHVAMPPKVISCKQIVVPTTIFNTQDASVNNDSSLKMAVEVAKTWKPGSTLSVSFIGRANVPDAVIESVKEFAHIWSQHGNIFFNFIGDGLVGLIRISFTPGGGNCSAVGTDCQLKDFNGQYTMNLDPEEDINERSLQSEEGKAVFRQIVLHEFGHVLGCVHEHQQPKANIKWDKDRVYTAFGGHSKKKRDLIDVNIFEHYPQNPAIVAGTEHDKDSIMHYEFTPT
ncbi:hypothetical protein QCA50_014732 [Cerrena zonata]|uniref:Peptidase metallopeptidase domain-containing protein n=1 Tax=Cerrena zonata TaxID=2478898 RepID=A0AAW0FTG3_9APHY